MKKISKEFWVNDYTFNWLKKEKTKSSTPLSYTVGGNISFHTEHDKDNPRNKIIISWEEPEKKIEISESEFDRAFRDTNFNDSNDWNLFRNDLKQKLFGKTE